MYLYFSFLRQTTQLLFSCTPLTDFTLWDVKYLGNGEAMRNAVCDVERNFLTLFTWISGFKWLDIGERTDFNMTGGYIAMQSVYISGNYGANLVSAVSLQNLASHSFPCSCSYLQLPSGSVMTCITAFIPHTSIKCMTGLTLYNDRSTNYTVCYSAEHLDEGWIMAWTSLLAY